MTGPAPCGSVRARRVRVADGRVRFVRSGARATSVAEFLSVHDLDQTAGLIAGLALLRRWRDKQNQ